MDSLCEMFYTWFPMHCNRFTTVNVSGIQIIARELVGKSKDPTNHALINYLKTFLPGVVVEEAPQNLAGGDAKWEAIINKEEDMADAAAYQVSLVPGYVLVGPTDRGLYVMK